MNQSPRIVAAVFNRHAPPSKTKEPEAPSTWRGHLACCLLITSLLTLPAQAQLDTGSNGMSDIWERHFNQGTLFDPENPDHLPHADPDGDGWTNLIESFAGTNPFDSKPPEGIVPAFVVHLKDQEEAPSAEYPEGRLIDLAIISWDTLPGKKYTLTHSADLTANSWVATDVPHYGEGDPIAVTITLNQTGGIAPEKFFWRVAIEDTDSDTDGLTDHEEFLLGLNPNSSETHAGISDLWVATHFPNSAATFDPNHVPFQNGLTYLDMHDLGIDPNQDVVIGPVNFGSAEVFDPGGIVTSFRDPAPPTPPDSPEPYDPHSSEYHPSDLYDQNSIDGWKAVLGEFIEIWDENIGPRNANDPAPHPSPYFELQAHFGAKGIKQQFNMLPGTSIAFLLGYKGRYYWDGYDNAFTLEVEGAETLMVDGSVIAASNGVSSRAFMDDDDWEKYEDWHCASVVITADPSATSLVPIKLSFIPVNTEISNGQEITHGGFVGILPVHLAVDANRDEAISFDQSDATTIEMPYRFWINNDQDDVEVDEPVLVDENARDLLDSTIDTNRDLEDFTRLKIFVGIPLNDLQEGNFQVGVKFKNPTPNGPAIRLWPNESAHGSRNYLTDGTAAGRQRQKICYGDTLNGAVWIPKSYWTGRNDAEAHLIFEGVKKGQGELVVIVKPIDALHEIESASLHLKLLDVREMYQRARIVNTAEQIPSPWIDDAPPAQTWAWDPWNWPLSEDPQAEPVTAVFVHGWRLKYMDFMNWSDTSYKRLWHQGFKGKFYSFRWATYSGDNNGLPYGLDEQMEGTNFPPGGTTYNASEYRAWLCGPQLAAFVNQLPNPGRRSLFAHSMGNVIAGAALRSGMRVDQYALCNAAVATMCYDPNPALRNDLNGSPWNNLFFGLQPHTTPDTDSDPDIRVSFGLENKFNEEDEMPRIFNFGLPEDTALNSWILNNLHFKPDDGPGGHHYRYEHYPQPPNLTYKLFQAPVVGNPRKITSQPEAMGYVTKSLTRPAGLDLRVRGAIQDSHNMSSWGPDANHSGFGEVHSAQWRWSYQSTHLFWNRLYNELELDYP